MIGFETYRSKEAISRKLTPTLQTPVTIATGTTWNKEKMRR